MHGPYTLYAACYPASFDPNCNHEGSLDGKPDFEPNLKAGGSWSSKLSVPGNIRESAGVAKVRRTTNGEVPHCTWIIEVSSQVIFSTSATVHFELLVGRDERSTDLGFSALAAHPVATPGHLEDHQEGRRAKHGHGAGQSNGVFSTAVKLMVEDTESLWNKPTLPEWPDESEKQDTTAIPVSRQAGGQSEGTCEAETMTTLYDSTNYSRPRKRKKIHLVIVTHGLHSNLGSDMLYIKESIDAAAKAARKDAQERKKTRRKDYPSEAQPNAQTTELGSTSDERYAKHSEPGDNPDSEDEEVVVRGFQGNAVRTERGIQYLGKRLAKFVLSFTYPDQPFLPAKKSVARSLSRALTGDQSSEQAQGPSSHLHSSIHRPSKKPQNLAYKITSISFIAHSLGGLTQTYAVAYIHKHSPEFFQEIKPVNFVAMASPFLGLSNENPLYVKFALNFGLVGRTGQDLGLAWRAPTVVRNGWDAMIGGIGSEGQRARKEPDPRSKPLLRILPTGPAHQVLKLFRNRTVYSNVVNDGIVPLRTSCLLFLDWRGLDRVEKARREFGLVGAMAGWGWAEITGANATSHRQNYGARNGEDSSESDESDDEAHSSSKGSHGRKTVPQPSDADVRDDASVKENEDMEHLKPDETLKERGRHFQDEVFDAKRAKDYSRAQPPRPLDSILAFFRPNKAKSHHHSPKQAKIYKRGQTTIGESTGTVTPSSESTSEVGTSPPKDRPGMARGGSMLDDPNNVFAPPKTTFFESAGDILNPPLPPEEYLVNPESRPRTIFHDRVYHPDDIPQPPTKKRGTLSRTFSSEGRSPSRSSTDSSQNSSVSEAGAMKVEEKIARSYHNGLSWRKVLVRLEPDAHNNICVRRMFSNAYGWPVIKHLVDTHFSDTYEANTADRNESTRERARPMEEGTGKHGEEVKGEPETPPVRTNSELQEANDNIADLKSANDSSMSSAGGRRKLSRKDSAQWDDALFDISDDDSESESAAEAKHRHGLTIPNIDIEDDSDQRKGTSDAEIAEFLTASPKATDASTHVAFRPGGSFPEISSGGTTRVGLSKSIDTQLSASKRSVQNEDKDTGDSIDGGIDPLDATL